LPTLARPIAKCIRLPVEKCCANAYGFRDLRYPRVRTRSGTLEGTNLSIRWESVEAVTVILGSAETVSPSHRTLPEISPKVGGAPVRFLVVGSLIDCELLGAAVKCPRQPLDVVV
jgi:hypothetical protein